MLRYPSRITITSMRITSARSVDDYDVDLTLFRHKQLMTDIRIARMRRIRAILFYSSRSLTTYFRHIHVAQQVERPAVNRVVEGSSPSVGANKAICAKKQALFSRSPGRGRRFDTCHIHHMASWYNGNYAGLSRRRQGFNSP